MRTPTLRNLSRRLALMLLALVFMASTALAKTIYVDTGGNDAFVHISALEKVGLSALAQDQRVSYDLETDQRGKTSAVNLQVD